MKKCPSCKQEKLYTDHNHDTGKVRGLLCRGCNHALGHIKDDFDKALGLAKYLQEYEGII